MTQRSDSSSPPAAGPLPPEPWSASQPAPGRPGLAALSAGRVHEATGPGRLAFALALAGETSGAVLWVMDVRRREVPCPQGIGPLLDPGRLILVRPTGPLAALQATEESLRSGAVPLVIADLDAAPDLTQSRRLQLAASTGGGRGLCLVPERGLGANAAETRWHCAPICVRETRPSGAAQHAAQHWELIKNKRGQLGAWEVWLADRPDPVREAPVSPVAKATATAMRRAG